MDDRYVYLRHNQPHETGPEGITIPPSIEVLEQQTELGPRQETDHIPSLVEEDAATGIYQPLAESVNNIDVSVRRSPSVHGLTEPGSGHVRATLVTDEDEFGSSFAFSPSSLGDSVRYVEPNDPGRTGPLAKYSLRPHPNCGQDSPPCMPLKLSEYPCGPPTFPQQAHIRTSSDSSGDGTPPEQEHIPYGLQELAISGKRFSKDNERFSVREQTVDKETNVECLATFRNWPKEDVVSRQKLARAGFKYTGKGDAVICVKCHKKIHGWEKGNDPRSEHNKIYKYDCFAAY